MYFTHFNCLGQNNCNRISFCIHYTGLCCIVLSSNECKFAGFFSEKWTGLWPFYTTSCSYLDSSLVRFVPNHNQLVLARIFLNHITIHNHYWVLLTYPVYFYSMKTTLWRWLIEFSKALSTMIILLLKTLNSLKNLFR